MMGRRSVALLVVLGLVGSVTSAHASWTGENGRIGYVSARGEQRVIYWMDADGSDPQQVTTVKRSERSHSFSPDGEHLVVSRTVSDEQTDLFVITTEGAKVARLTDRKLGDAEASWSPDGSSIIYSHQNRSTGTWDIFTVDVDGTNRSRIVAIKGNEFWPRWSPDGDAIAYTKGYHGLHVMNPDGTNRRTLANWTYGHADWHPDGDRLVVQGAGPDRTKPGIYIVDELGLIVTSVVQQAGWAEPIFSPDGTKIVAQRDVTFADEDFKTGIYTMNLDGSDMTLIRTSAWGATTHLDWQAI